MNARDESVASSYTRRRVQKRARGKSRATTTSLTVCPYERPSIPPPQPPPAAAVFRRRSLSIPPQPLSVPLASPLARSFLRPLGRSGVIPPERHARSIHSTVVSRASHQARRRGGGARGGRINTHTTAAALALSTRAAARAASRSLPPPARPPT